MARRSATVPCPCSPTCRCCYNDARKKLSKRRDKVAVEDYRDEGYLPEAMRNYLALLGWSPGDNREILTLDELVAEFRLEDVKSAGAIFDERKLQAVNAEYLQGAPGSRSWSNGPRPGCAARWEPLAPQVQERARTLADVYALTDFLYLPNLGHRRRRVGPRRPEVSGLRGGAGGRDQSLLGPRGVDADGHPRRHGGRRRGRRGAQLGKAQAPIRLAVTGRAVGRPCGSRSRCWAGTRRWLAWPTPGGAWPRAPDRPGCRRRPAAANILRRPSGVV